LKLGIGDYLKDFPEINLSEFWEKCVAES